MAEVAGPNSERMRCIQSLVQVLKYVTECNDFRMQPDSEEKTMLCA